jgi:CheY-like chemotaxis protein
VEANAGNIHQCVLNLCINARDAIGEKTGSITVSLSSDVVNNKALVRVSDTGPGIPPDSIERIFDPFFTTKKDKGTGLGLSVVYGIMRAHKGQVSVESRPGEGASFILEFPLAPPESVQKRAPLKTIIVVDDDPLVRNFCTSLLDEKQIPVVSFSSGEESIDWLNANQDQAGTVLLDLSLPGLNGFETAEQLLEINKELKIIWITGVNNPEYIERAQGEVLLKKPFTTVQILRTLEIPAS